MFEEEKDEEYWMDLAEAMGEEMGVDTREGSVYMDMMAGHCMRIAKFYNDLALMEELLADDTASGDLLTEKAARDNVLREKAAPAYWSGIFEGVMPEEGAEFACGDSYFKWSRLDERFYLVSETAGASANLFRPGSELIPVENIDGLERAALGELIVPGKDEEDDESLRSRWMAEKRMPSKNGNKPHYKAWCEEVEGVGRAKIFPLWGGNLTVKAILLSVDGKNVSDDVVSAVQEYVDPIKKGYSVTVGGSAYIFGDGFGEGVANMGAHFLAESARPVKLTVSAEVILKAGHMLHEVKDAAFRSIEGYLANMALQSQDDVETIIRISTIGSMLAKLDGILDYDYGSLRINGNSENIAIDSSSVAVLSEVELYVDA